jgi:hypothetical protein
MCPHRAWSWAVIGSVGIAMASSACTRTADCHHAPIGMRLVLHASDRTLSDQIRSVRVTIAYQGERRAKTFDLSGGLMTDPSFEVDLGSWIMTAASIDVSADGFTAPEAGGTAVVHGMRSVLLTADLCNDVEIDLGASSVDGGLADGSMDAGEAGALDALADDGATIDAGAIDGATPDASPVACGKVGSATDDFGDGPNAIPWSTELSGTGTIAVAGGQIAFKLRTGGVDSDAEYDSNAMYEITESELSIEVVDWTTLSTSAYAFLQFHTNNDEIADFELQGTRLTLNRKHAGAWNLLTTLTYDATADHWWRVREHAGTVFYETSPDRMTWTTRATDRTNGLDAGWIEIGVVQSDSPTVGRIAPEAHFDNLNGGGTPIGGFCKMASLVDPLTDITASRLRTEVKSAHGCVIDESNGAVHMTLTSTVDSDCWYQTYTPFDLTESSATVHVPDMVNTMTVAVADLDLVSWRSSNTFIRMRQIEGQLQFIASVGGSYVVSRQIPYDPVAHQWWRIRETSGTVSWDTSDGTTWTTQAMTADPFPIEALFLLLESEIDVSVSQPGSATFTQLDGSP